MHATSDLQVMLRIYAETSDLDFPKAEKILALSLPDESVESVFTDDDQEIGMIKFKGAASTQTRGADHAVQGDNTREFVSAITWLNGRMPSQFDDLRKMGFAFDLFVQGFMGLVPIGLIQELSRLGLSLWIAPGGFTKGFDR